MDFLVQLWLPILVSAAIVWVASSILWMALPFHKNDFKGVPNEGALTDVIKSGSIAPGQYFLPFCGGKERNSPEFQARLKQGPWAFLIVSGQAPNFGRSLGLWFVNLVIVSLFVAYVARAALPDGTAYLTVFRVAGSASLLGYAGMFMSDAAWKGSSWSDAFKKVFDGVVYALLTGGVFGWLWPSAAAAIPS